jgi:uncharacterized protein (DUF697 family)
MSDNIIAGSDPVSPSAETVAISAPEAAPTETVSPAETVPASDAAAAELATARHADTVIRHNVYLAAATGIIPIAFVDTAALFVVQLKMLSELAHVYDKSFRADLGKSAVSALFASVAPAAVANGVMGTSLFMAFTHSVPVIGTALRLATMPAFGAAFTYAVGKVFENHFAHGGTLLSFEAEATRDYFKTKMNEFRGKAPAEPVAAAA